MLVFLTGRVEVLEAVRQLQDWQRRRDKRHAAVDDAAAADATEMEVDETASEADFELSDHSDDEPLPLEGGQSGESDSEASVHSGDSVRSRGNRAGRSRGRPSQELQLALASDAEEDDEPQEGVKEAEADVLHTVLTRPRPPTTQPVVKETESTTAAKPPRTGPKLTGTAETPSKRRKTETQARVSPQEAGPKGDGQNITTPFDMPDRVKRRVRNRVSAGGWLGAGAHLRQKPAETDGQDADKSTESQEAKKASKDSSGDALEETHIVPRLTALPLYATLPSELQKLAFEPPAPDERRIIVATNVAETSLTLPNVR